MMTGHASDTISNDSLVLRLEDAVTSLRRQLERHVEQESRWERTVRLVEDGWSHQTQHLSRQLATLETQLADWMHRWERSPRLTVVSPE
jgi:hypothetical protein